MTTSAAEIIRAYNKDREPERLALKMAAMRANVFSFYRGTAHLFWQRVHEAKVSPAAPHAWCSGDLHLENFGTYRGDNALAYFDINDFDEAALAPCDWEILRFMTSILVAAPSLHIDAADARALAEYAAETYRAEMRGGKARWIERRTASGAIDELMTSLKKRSQKRMLDRRTLLKKGRRVLDLTNERVLPASDADLKKLAAFCTHIGKQRAAETYFTFRDAARRIAGTGSLGIRRYVILVEGEGSPDGNVLLDLKMATPSTLATISPAAQPTWQDEATRVAVVQRRCQAIAPALLGPVAFDGRSFVLKELQPSADRLDLSVIASDRPALSYVIETMARLAAWAQLRASGHGTSATADDLIAFASSDASLPSRLAAAAANQHAIVRADFEDFSRAPDPRTPSRPSRTATAKT